MKSALANQLDILCVLLQETLKKAKVFQVRAQDISPSLFLLFKNLAEVVVLQYSGLFLHC